MFCHVIALMYAVLPRKYYLVDPNIPVACLIFDVLVYVSLADRNITLLKEHTLSEQLPAIEIRLEP